MITTPVFLHIIVSFLLSRFFGRKACIRPLSDGMSASNDEKQEDNDEEEETSDKENDAKKTHKVEHKKNDKKLRFWVTTTAKAISCGWRIHIKI